MSFLVIMWAGKFLEKSFQDKFPLISRAFCDFKDTFPGQKKFQGFQNFQDIPGQVASPVYIRDKQPVSREIRTH